MESGIHSVEFRIQECPGLLYITQKRRLLTVPGIIKKLARELQKTGRFVLIIQSSSWSLLTCSHWYSSTYGQTGADPGFSQRRGCKYQWEFKKGQGNRGGGGEGEGEGKGRVRSNWGTILTQEPIMGSWLTLGRTMGEEGSGCHWGFREISPRG